MALTPRASVASSSPSSSSSTSSSPAAPKRDLRLRAESSTIPDSGLPPGGDLAESGRDPQLRALRPLGEVRPVGLSSPFVPFAIAWAMNNSASRFTSSFSTIFCKARRKLPSCTKPLQPSGRSFLKCFRICEKTLGSAADRPSHLMDCSKSSTIWECAEWSVSELWFRCRPRAPTFPMTTPKPLSTSTLSGSNRNALWSTSAATP
mmetsp:Transcript_51996/g.118578  ORF Transcript_51996/g.118578 Transcript_51996/m.118578 type:complete len:205 (-) Transcript_51996:141-755(-)